MLNKLPKSVQPKVKEALHKIWMAETWEQAYQVFDRTVKHFGDKYTKAMDCLEKDNEQILK